MQQTVKQFNVFGGIDTVKPDPGRVPELKTDKPEANKFAAFGLDTNKRATDADEVSREFYDPWLQDELHGGKYISLCFSNWVLSRETIDAFLQQEPELIDAGDMCFRCRQRPTHLHYHIASQPRTSDQNGIGICDECVHWADDFLHRLNILPPPPPAGTQLGLF